jgi:hypothetical protein
MYTCKICGKEFLENDSDGNAEIIADMGFCYDCAAYDLWDSYEETRFKKVG